MVGNKKKKIIILDDDKFLVNMYAMKFDNKGIEVITVSSGEELIKKLKDGERADLLLLDIIVPGLSGTEALKQIKKEKLAEGVKIVMLSNQSAQEEIEKAKALKIDGYIVKAMATPSEVVEKVLAIMNS